MNCPSCGREMAIGKIRMLGNHSGKAMFTPGAVPLKWKRFIRGTLFSLGKQKPGKIEIVSIESQTGEAYFCQACVLIVARL